MPEALPLEWVLMERFVLGRVLSYSDFSIIYLAWDTLLHRRVVIREFFPVHSASRNAQGYIELSQIRDVREAYEKSKARFLEESRQLSASQSLRCLVHVYRCFEENGTAYAVMEYLKGCTLEDYIRENGENAIRERADELFSQICGVVTMIHKKSLVHYNISPDSLYILEDNQLCLIDFGAAKLEYELGTKESVPLLNPRYAAPEIRQGTQIGMRADMYSLGAVYYRLLTGQDPPAWGRRNKPFRAFLKQNTKAARIVNMLMEPDPMKRAESIGQLVNA